MSRDFMLTRNMNRRCVMHGLRVVERPGNVPNGVERVEISFVPGKITTVEDDELDLRHAVDDKLIVEVGQRRLKEWSNNHTEVANSLSDPSNIMPEMEPGDVKVCEEVIEEDVEADAEEDVQDAEEEDAEDVELVEKQEESYIQLESGKFQCLLCKKEGITKVLSTEGWLKNHLEKNHK